MRLASTHALNNSFPCVTDISRVDMLDDREATHQDSGLKSCKNRPIISCYRPNLGLIATSYVTVISFTQ